MDGGDTRPAGIVAVMGPTATGKTALAMALAERLGGEIVSVDSAQVFRGMDVGTAKPDADELARAPHRLIDLIDPAESYSAGQFRRDALAAIDEIVAAGRTPILAGGTMLYFRALLEGIDPLPDADPAVRRAIDARAAESGWPALHAELARLDPAAAARIHPNDSQRIQRALEVRATSGRPLSEWQAGRGRGFGHAVAKIGLIPADRDALHARIATRFERMLAAGLVDEVAALRARGDLTAAHPSMRAVGYRQIWAHLDGGCSLEQAVADAVTATRRLAKRQLTWLRREPDLFAVDPFAGDVRPRVFTYLADFAGDAPRRLC